MRRLILTPLLLIVAVTATGCGDYPSDSEQVQAAADIGFDCTMTTTSSFFDNAEGLCTYRSATADEICTAQVEISDKGSVVNMERERCTP